MLGPHYRGGKQFYFGDLGVTGPEGVKRFELRDLDGDGHDEIIVQKNIGTRDKYRGVFEVFKVGRDDTPFEAFAHEVSIVTPRAASRTACDSRRRAGATRSRSRRTRPRASTRAPTKSL